MNTLTAPQVRILGCLIEKKESTPEQYPLTLNSLRNACNQKSSRYPVVDYTEGEVGHALRELQSIDLVREEWGTRVPKYAHLANSKLNLHTKGLALLCVLMLRGPQTLGELKTHSHRLFEFADLDDVQFVLKQLSEQQTAMVVVIPSQPGQKEDRYAHLLSGEPDSPVINSITRTTPSSVLETRIEQLENELETLKQRLDTLEAR